MMKPRVVGTMWKGLVADPEALCALGLGNLAALILLLVLELWLGGR